jgi:hypothetical protein
MHNHDFIHEIRSQIDAVYEIRIHERAKMYYRLPRILFYLCLYVALLCNAF